MNGRIQGHVIKSAKPKTIKLHDAGKSMWTPRRHALYQFNLIRIARLTIDIAMKQLYRTPGVRFQLIILPLISKLEVMVMRKNSLT